MRGWEGGKVRWEGHGAWGRAQSMQKVENKSITTERHGTARKDSVYEYVVSVQFRGEKIQNAEVVYFGKWNKKAHSRKR